MLAKTLEMLRPNLLRVLAVTLLSCCTVAPLHAQFSFWDRYDFGNCGVDFGCQPIDLGQLTQYTDGLLYGTASQGGMHSFGAIFGLSTLGAYTDGWEFSGYDGAYPNGGLTLASDGNFYGVTTLGGASNQGEVFVFTPANTINSSSLKVLHSFNGTDGLSPYAPPVQGKDGNLYGVTGSGTTYTITLPSQTFTQLPQNAPSGSYGPLLLASDGNLYGTSAGGGTDNDGTVFRMTTPGGAIQIIHSFNGTDGYGPGCPLTQPSDGYLYGTTQVGGVNQNGNIFKMTLAGKIVKNLSFDPYTSSGTNYDGSEPITGLLAASDGYLYGVNQGGGANAFGTIYQLSTAMVFNKLFDFTGSTGPATGEYPQATLMQASDGSLNGLTDIGGASAQGNYFQLTAINFRLILMVEGPIFVAPGIPVQIIGSNLTHVIQLTFGGGVQTQFQANSDNYLTVTVPFAALDGTITAVYDTGLSASTNSAVHILPAITRLSPPSGPIGTVVTISGGGFTGAKKVTFGGVATGNFHVISATEIQATVPSGAKTGKVAVTTKDGSAKSAQKFTVN